MGYNEKSLRVTLNGKPVAQGDELLREIADGIEAARAGIRQPDTIVMAPITAARARSLTMALDMWDLFGRVGPVTIRRLPRPKRLTTSDDVARIDRAEAKRARKAAARR